MNIIISISFHPSLDDYESWKVFVNKNVKVFEVFDNVCGADVEGEYTRKKGADAMKTKTLETVKWNLWTEKAKSLSTIPLYCDDVTCLFAL